jgi:ubiquinone/menaquinone biosynthesis C-methylase UbiE
LAERLPLGPGRTVLDLAAGTGKLTRQLVPTGATVIAMEPLAEMRAELERAVPSAEALDGTAESIPLSDGSVDAITVAQAFHWFRVREAAREVQRVLRPGGTLAIMWNTRDPDYGLHDAISEVIEPFRAASPTHRDYRWKSELAEMGLFAGPDERVFDHVHTVDVDTLVDRYASVSFIAELPEEQRLRVLDGIRALVEGYEEPIEYPYLTRLYVYDRV